MVEGARLESVYAGNRIEGSNPSLSAMTSTDFNNLQRKTWAKSDRGDENFDLTCR